MSAALDADQTARPDELQSFTFDQISFPAWSADPMCGVKIVGSDADYGGMDYDAWVAYLQSHGIDGGWLRIWFADAGNVRTDDAQGAFVKIYELRSTADAIAVDDDVMTDPVFCPYIKSMFLVPEIPGAIGLIDEGANFAHEERVTWVRGPRRYEVSLSGISVKPYDGIRTLADLEQSFAK